MIAVLLMSCLIIDLLFERNCWLPVCQINRHSTRLVQVVKRNKAEVECVKPLSPRETRAAICNNCRWPRGQAENCTSSLPVLPPRDRHSQKEKVCHLVWPICNSTMCLLYSSNSENNLLFDKLFVFKIVSFVKFLKTFMDHLTLTTFVKILMLFLV